MPLATCHVCERYTRCDMDHPIPQRIGGTATIPLCLTCHDMKDRLPLEKWDPVQAERGFASMWGGLPADGRLMLLKMFSIVAEANHLRQACSAEYEAMLLGYYRRQYAIEAELEAATGASTAVARKRRRAAMVQS